MLLQHFFIICHMKCSSDRKPQKSLPFANIKMFAQKKKPNTLVVVVHQAQKHWENFTDKRKSEL